MSHEALGKLLDRWIAEPEFRAAVKENPLAAIAAAGVTLNEEEQAAVAAVDWSLSD